MSIAWGRALQDGKRWDYYGCVHLNCSMMLSLAKTGWPECEEAFLLTICEVPSTTISNLKQAIIDRYKALLVSVLIELAAFPQVLAACEAKSETTRNSSRGSWVSSVQDQGATQHTT
jgi:hypothetical protein